MSSRFTVLSPPGVEITIHDFGGTGPALFFLPANGFHGLCYQPLASHLQEYFHSYGIDLRGQGDSPISLPSTLATELVLPLEVVQKPLSSLPTLSGFISDLKATADHLGLEEAYVFGHSAGGAAAVGAAQECPRLIKGLYLYEPIMRSPAERARQEADHSENQDNSLLRQMALKRRTVFPSKAVALESYGTRGFRSFHPAALAAYVDHGFRELPGQEGWSLKCDVLGEAFVYENVLPMGDPFWPGVSRLGCPVTVGLGNVRGAAMQGSKLFAEEVAAECKHAQLHRYPRLGHFGPFEDPELIAREVIHSFLPDIQDVAAPSKL